MSQDSSDHDSTAQIRDYPPESELIASIPRGDDMSVRIMFRGKVISSATAEELVSFSRLFLVTRHSSNLMLSFRRNGTSQGNGEGPRNGMKRKSALNYKRRHKLTMREKSRYCLSFQPK